MAIEISILQSGDDLILTRVAVGVFDNPIHPGRFAEFLADPRHHIAVAVECGLVVGFCSAVHYIHPDKPPELWINEIGVAPTHQGRGLGKQLLQAILNVGRELGCAEAWVLTDRANPQAMRLYASNGGTEAAPDLAMFTFKLP